MARFTFFTKKENLTCPNRYTPAPITNADIAVPKMANTSIEPIFWKKFPLCKLYPDSNIIGGNKTRKNIVGGKLNSFYWNNLKQI